MALFQGAAQHRASSIAPVTMRRGFRVHHECAECQAPGETDVQLLDEVNDSATVEDFYASGALERMEPQCSRCGCTSIVVTSVGYIRQPTDARE